MISRPVIFEISLISSAPLVHWGLCLVQKCGNLQASTPVSERAAGEQIAESVRR